MTDSNSKIRLGTFRIPETTWKDFVAKARSNGDNASSILLNTVHTYLNNEVNSASTAIAISTIPTNPSSNTAPTAAPTIAISPKLFPLILLPLPRSQDQIQHHPLIHLYLSSLLSSLLSPPIIKSFTSNVAFHNTGILHTISAMLILMLIIASNSSLHPIPPSSHPLKIS